MDFENIIHTLIDPLVEKPEKIVIKELSGGGRKDVTLLIIAEDDDTARLIGKRGAVAKALREVIGIVGKADNSNLRIHLKFESFLEKENDAE